VNQKETTCQTENVTRKRGRNKSKHNTVLSVCVDLAYAKCEATPTVH
jgi:hypothetical protein